MLLLLLMMRKAMRAKTALYIFDGEPATTRPAMPLSITKLNVLAVEWHVFGEKSIIASSCLSATRCNRYDAQHHMQIVQDSGTDCLFHPGRIILPRTLYYLILRKSTESRTKQKALQRVKNRVEEEHSRTSRDFLLFLLLLRQSGQCTPTSSF